MKIKRFFATNMREAMRMVREEQGADAVILSNRRVEGGVEVVAATDYDAALVQQAATRVETRPSTPVMEPVVSVAAKRESTPPPIKEVPVQMPKAMPAIISAAAPAEKGGDSAIDELRQEIGSMKRLMEQQVAGLIWNDTRHRNPAKAGVLRSLMGIGLDSALARQIADEMPESSSGERARFLPMGLLARKIPVFKNEWLDAGGVVALVGPTGVGKTTTIAKLAARYARDFGLREVALITTDHYRIGAQEQLFTYGRLLGVPVLTADTHKELEQALDRLRDRKLVLIDTAGMSPRDGNLASQMDMLAAISAPVRTALVVGANSQMADLQDQFKRFAPASPSAAILTKLDEATRVGAVISVLVKQGLPMAYVADGQRVPEDIHVARADQLVIRAMQLARTQAPTPDEEALALQFTGAVNA
jgi:flagellar biosynthesis protein FlhF